jgi:class 3 adenylate cyclase
VQQVGYVAPEIGGLPALHEVVITRIVDQVAQRGLGALALGFAVDVATAADEPPAPALASILGGVWFEDGLHSREIPAAVAPALAGAMAGEARGDAVVQVHGEPHRVFSHRLHAESQFPPAYQVALYSTAAARAEQRSLQRTVLGFGVLALLLGLVLSLVISRGLAVPVRQLVAATEEIGRGNFAMRVAVRARDEMGRLAASFNAMAEGLALKERYRSVLDVVADRRIADELVRGRLELGGEPRQVTIVFCDIRGFTARTEGMPPGDVVQLLNEHMTALAGVVHAHGGVVDKYMGDALMALFGAPRTTSADAANAVRAAWGMVQAREGLNRHSARPIQVGIGVASGLVVAGCMGSADRLSYTVVGERVTLAARLCAQAGPGEIVIDEATWRALDGAADADLLPPQSLKGFSTPVTAYRVRGLGGATLAS